MGAQQKDVSRRRPPERRGTARTKRNFSELTVFFPKWNGILPFARFLCRRFGHLAELTAGSMPEIRENMKKIFKKGFVFLAI
ncbi:MAG: hypothetical protein IKD96_03940 [Oscillospiraceae bacterium]|nr:hypothetical protein [Oscillospiraceae bacterium]